MTGAAVQVDFRRFRDVQQTATAYAAEPGKVAASTSASSSGERHAFPSATGFRAKRARTSS